MDDAFTRARNFIHTQGRLLERLLFSVRFENTAPESIGRVIAAYQNSDGGLGHALEPDFRCPESQPLFIEIGLSALCDAGCKDAGLSLSICRFLERNSGPDGLVPMFFQNALESTHAPHMTQVRPPGLNPTCGICGFLHYQGVKHPWLDRATRTCCRLLLDNPSNEAHEFLSASHLVDYLPDRQTAQSIFQTIASNLDNSEFFMRNAPVKKYGVTPLHFARTPDSRWRSMFSDEQITGHLEDLLRKQQEDGGWPISWQAAGPAATCEWRGRWTLEAVSTLEAYGYIEKPSVIGGILMHT